MAHEKEGTGVLRWLVRMLSSSSYSSGHAVHVEGHLETMTLVRWNQMLQAADPNEEGSLACPFSFPAEAFFLPLDSFPLGISITTHPCKWLSLSLRARTTHPQMKKMKI